MKKILNVKYSVDRKEEFQIKTVIYEDLNGKFACKEPYTSKAKQHIENIYQNYKMLSCMRMNIAESILGENKIEFPYIEGGNFAQLLLEDIAKKDLVNFTNNLLKYKELLMCEELVPFEVTEEFCEIFGESVNLPLANSHKVSNIDLNFENVLVNENNQFYIIDYEWVFAFTIPLEYVMFRAVTQFFERYRSKINNFISKEAVYSILEVDSNNLLIYESMENKFSSTVANGWVNQRKAYYKPNFSKYEIIDQFIENKKVKVNNLQYFWASADTFMEKDSKFIAMHPNGMQCQITLPDEKTNLLRIDPGDRPLVYIQMKLADKDLVLDGYSGLYLIDNENSTLEFITLSNDPQLIFKNIKSNTIHLEITLKNDIDLIVNKIVERGLFYRGQLKLKEQQNLEHIEKIDVLQKDIEIIRDEVKEKNRVIEQTRLESEQRLSYIEELKAENFKLLKINSDILNSKRWKLLSIFSKNR